MKIELPPMARLNTPPTPPPPPICVDVCMTIDCVIHESSPELGEECLARVERDLEHGHCGADYPVLHLVVLRTMSVTRSL